MIKLQNRYYKIRTRLQQRKLRACNWYDPQARSDVPAVFVGGCGRSGTTLFKELLNRHSRLACGSETSMYGLPFDVMHIAPYWEIPVDQLRAQQTRSRNLLEFADWFYQEHLLKPQGKVRWVDKTPNNVRVISQLLTWYPRGRFIHVIRDGRDVVCSLRNHPKEKVVKGRIVPLKTNNPIRKCARRWLIDTSCGLALSRHPRCLEVRYEDLVEDTERQLKRVCDFIDEPFEPAMLDANSSNTASVGHVLNNPEATQRISNKSIGRWKHDLSMQERQDFVDIAGELLIALQYVEDHAWASR